MRNNKFKKSAVAAVIATSLFSVSSVSFASSSLQEVVDNARKDIKNSAYSYVVPAQAGKLATSKDLYPALNTAKANYQKARNEIIKSSAKNKALLLKNLDELYHERVTKGIVPYIDAYNYADKYLNPIMKEIELAEASKDWDKLEKAYHKLSVQLKTRTAILYRFTGKAARDLLLDQYKEPANQKREELMVPVTIFMKAKEAEAYIVANKEQEAVKVLESINLLIEQLPSNSTPIIKDLLAYVEKISGQTNTNFTLSLMHVNDTHARTSQAPKRLTAIKEVRAENPSALLIDAGDVFSGTLYFNEFKGQADLELMKLMDYDVMTFGNHEFDLGDTSEGHKALKEFIEKSNFPFVSSNVDFSKDVNLKGLFNVNVSADPKDGQIYSGIIKEIDGQKVGLFGLTTAETATISSPKDVAFTDYIKAAQTMVDEFEKQGVNKVVAVTHIGYDDNPMVDNDLLLAAAVNGIDVIVGGHSHTKLEKPILVEKDSSGKAKDPTIIVQASQYSEFLGALDVDFDEKGKVVGHAGKLTEIKDQVADPAAAALLKTYSDKIDTINKAEIGVIAEEELETPRTAGDDTKPSVRKNETALGNIITDGMLLKAKQYDNKVIMALQNGGGIRAEIGKGPITVGEVITVLPYGNTLATMEITGAELKSAFEISFKTYPKENGGFLHVAGAKVEFDSSKPAGERVVSIKYKAADGSFVDIKDTEKYVVATNAFTAKGGDDYDVFEKIYKEGRVTDLGLSDWENLQEQLKTLKTVKNTTEGRIVDVKK